MIRSKAVAKLDAWLEGAKASLIGSFANGVEKDIAASATPLSLRGRMARPKARSPSSNSSSGKCTAAPRLIFAPGAPRRCNLGCGRSESASEPILHADSHLGRTVRDISRQIASDAELDALFKWPLYQASTVLEQRQRQRGRKSTACMRTRWNASVRARRTRPTSSG